MIITKKKSLKIHHEKANKNTPPKLKKKHIRTGCLNKKAVMKILNFNKITIW